MEVDKDGPLVLTQTPAYARLDYRFAAKRVARQAKSVLNLGVVP